MKRWTSFLAVALVVSTGTATHADESADLVVAKGWLAAAADGGVALESATAFPFVYRTTNKTKMCERAVRDASAFSKWAACFRKQQKLLLGEIKAGANLRMVSAQDTEPKALRAIAEKIHGDGRWLRAFINGDGATYTFLFRVSGGNGTGKLTAVVLEEEVENGYSQR